MIQILTNFVGGALYIRPLLFGSGPRIGLQPADEYTFICMVLPVADYYKGGLSKPVSALVKHKSLYIFVITSELLLMLAVFVATR